MKKRGSGTAAAPSAADPILEKVLADPEDAALRAVWADALQERGDPRGELIALQLAAIEAKGPLTPAQDKRMRALFAKHTAEWLGPLAGVVMKKAGLVFDRGLVSSCQIQIKNLATLALVTGNPLWATVRRLWFCDHHAWDARLVPFLADPAFRLLREVRCIGTNEVFARLAVSERRLPITSVWAYDDGWRSPTPDALRDGPAREAPALPDLRTFGLVSSGVDPRWVFRLPFLERLETLGLSLPIPVGACIEQAQRIANLKRLEIRPNWIIMHGAYRPHALLELERDAAGRFSTLTIGVGHYRGPFAPRLDAVAPTAAVKKQAEEDAVAALPKMASLVDTIPADLLERIKVRLPETTKLRTPLRRFSKAEVSFVGVG